MSTKRINLISGPRNISTALMYSFGNRPDTDVVDEPMYAYYLNETGISHPGRMKILESLPKRLEDVKEKLLFNETKVPYYFIKGMAHHYLDIDLSFLLKMKNIFLIRDPKKLIFSFSKVIKNPNLGDIGIKREYELFEYLDSRGEKTLVLDSNEVLKSPRKILTKLCEHLGIPFSEAMLVWPKGPRKEDGVWAPYWYANVHKSTGFQKNITKDVDLPENLVSLYHESLPYYEALFEKSIKA